MHDSYKLSKSALMAVLSVKLQDGTLVVLSTVLSNLPHQIHRGGVLPIPSESGPSFPGGPASSTLAPMRVAYPRNEFGN